MSQIILKTKRVFKPASRAFSHGYTNNSINERRRVSYQHGTYSVPLLSEHISERLRSITHRFPSNPAVISASQNIELSYEQLNARVDSIARGLIALGLKKGDRIGIYSPNKVEWTIL